MLVCDLFNLQCFGCRFDGGLIYSSVFEMGWMMTASADDCQLFDTKYTVLL